MTDPKLPELFAERPIRSDFARQGGRRLRVRIPYVVRRIITIAVLISAVGGALYWGFGHHTPSAPGEIPTIKSDGAYKQRPEQPGGLDIPNQDVQVYQQIDNSKTPEKPEVEHLLPPPETPTAPAPQAAAPPTPQQLESLTPEKKIPTTASQPETAPAPIAAPTPPVQAAPQQAVQSAPSKPAKETPPAATSTAPKTIDDVLKDVAQSKSTAGDSAVQLASVQDPASAQAMMKKFQSQYASILGDNQLHVVKANLGTKGTYYRIQSQGMSADQAKTMCAALKNAKAGCIIVHP